MTSRGHRLQQQSSSQQHHQTGTHVGPPAIQTFQEFAHPNQPALNQDRAPSRTFQDLPVGFRHTWRQPAFDQNRAPPRPLPVMRQRQPASSSNVESFLSSSTHQHRISSEVGVTLYAIKDGREKVNIELRNIKMDDQGRNSRPKIYVNKTNLPIELQNVNLVLKILGSGSFGSVFRGEDRGGVQIACKLMKSRRDWEQEYKMMEYLQSNMQVVEEECPFARLLEKGKFDNIYFLVYPFLKGYILADFFNSQTVTPLRYLAAFQGVCAAVHQLQAKGKIRHRDLKGVTLPNYSSGVGG